jgi:hypothetical protein
MKGKSMTIKSELRSFLETKVEEFLTKGGKVKKVSYEKPEMTYTNTKASVAYIGRKQATLRNMGY